MNDLFELPSAQFSKRLLKAYEESKHPRDEKGRWTAGQALAAAGLVAAAPGISNVVRVLRRFDLPAYGTRRMVRTGQARTRIGHAFRSPYHEGLRALTGTRASTAGEQARRDMVRWFGSARERSALRPLIR